MDPLTPTAPSGSSRKARWLFFASLPSALFAAGSLVAPWLWLGELCVHFSGLAAISLIPALTMCWRQPVQAVILLLALGIGCWPWLRSALEPRTAITDQPLFTIATANLYDFNRDRDVALTSLGALEVDVLALQETHAPDRQALIQRWPYAVVTEHRHLLASSLFSRYPITWSLIHDLGGYALIDALVQTPTGQVRIYVAHVHSPTSPGALANRTRQLQQLAMMIRESAEPVLLLGDLNVGTVSPRWSLFADQANLRRPHGDSPGTWPAWLRFAGTDIDRIAGRGVAFTSLTPFPIPGSDHRGLMTGVALR